MRRKPQPSQHDFPRHRQHPAVHHRDVGCSQHLQVSEPRSARHSLAKGGWPPSCCGKQVFQRLGFPHISPADSAKGKNSHIICSGYPFVVVYALRCSLHPQLQFTPPAAAYAPAAVYTPTAIYVPRCSLRPRCSEGLSCSFRCSCNLF